jgi:hypothetical protein
MKHIKATYNTTSTTLLWEGTFGAFTTTTTP